MAFYRGEQAVTLLLQILYDEGVIESYDTLVGDRGGMTFYWIALKGDKELFISESGAVFTLTQKGV